MHYPWVISSVPVSHILSTRESYPQYPWVISSVPVRICSTRESYHQYPWVISLVLMRVCSICEDMQYLWGKFNSFIIRINLLTGTAYPHWYWGYDSRVLRIWLTGTTYPHGYWGYDLRVMHTLTGTEDITHRYWWYDSQVMHILTATAYSLYRVILHNYTLHTIHYSLHTGHYTPYARHYTLDTTLCQVQDGGGVVGNRIYWRLRFYWYIFKISRFRDFVSNFHEIAEILTILDCLEKLKNSENMNISYINLKHVIRRNM